MFEKFKNELLSELSGLDADTLECVVNALTKLSAKYNITEACTSLAVIGKEEAEGLVKTYLVVRKSEGISQRTFELYGKILETYVRNMRQPLGKTTTNDLRLYLITYKETHKISDRTLDLYRVVLHSFFSWLYNEEYIPKDISRNVKPIKYQRRQKPALTQMELEQIRSACQTDRETCLINLLYSTGCRVSEVTGIQMSDINWENKSITVTGKGNKVRTVYLNAKAIVSMRKYLSTRKYSGMYLLEKERGGGQVKAQSIEKLLQKIVARSGVKKHVTPHTLRHTFATTALDNGMPVTSIQRALGHASINTTMVYAEVNDNSVKEEHRRSVI